MNLRTNTEVFNMTFEEICKKHNIYSDGLERRYLINVHERRYDMEHTTPFELQILVPQVWENSDPLTTINPCCKSFESRSWVQLIKDVVLYLQEKNPKSEEDLISFKTDWSKATIFSRSKSIDNMVEINPDLYVSVNYTATHSLWFIGDILSFYGISIGCLLIHRPPLAETEEVRTEIKELRINQFREFLLKEKNLSEEKTEKVIKAFGPFNKLLNKIATSYDDLFLFDNTIVFSSYKSKLLASIPRYTTWSEGQIATANKYLDYLTSFYTKLVKEAKSNKDKLKHYIAII